MILKYIAAAARMIAFIAVVVFARQAFELGVSGSKYLSQFSLIAILIIQLSTWFVIFRWWGLHVRSRTDLQSSHSNVHAESEANGDERRSNYNFTVESIAYAIFMPISLTMVYTMSALYVICFRLE